MAREMAIFRVIAILMGGAITFWIATGVTLNLTLAWQAPAVAQIWWPIGVTAKIAQGIELLGTAPQLPPATVDSARETLRDAALREPVSTQALATLAALDDYRNDKSRARALFRLSEAVSRRNTLTEFWLIEDSVSRGDVPDAIKHYNRAMLVSNDAVAALIPVLATAASEPAILKSLLPVLARRPLWWKYYLQRLGSNGDNALVMAASIKATRLDVRNADDRGLAENILRRMLALKEEHMAILAANRLDGLPGSARSLQGGNFETAESAPPFAWWLRDEASIRAYRDRVPNGSMGLRIVTTADASGDVARQLVGLQSGRYVLNGIIGNSPTDPIARPSIAMACAAGKQLSRFLLPSADGRGRNFHFSFEIPATECTTQWITIVSAPAIDTDVWLDNLAITQ